MISESSDKTLQPQDVIFNKIIVSGNHGQKSDSLQMIFNQKNQKQVLLTKKDKFYNLTLMDKLEQVSNSHLR